jgi:hypothetical protein
MLSCKKHPACSRLYRKSGRVKLHDIYRVHLARRQGQDIWVVDGGRVVSALYPAFIMGGNDQRYRFNPENEIWIDNRIGIEEFCYTVQHELIERKLMRERGWSYDRAHSQGGLEREGQLRLRQKRLVARKEAAMLPMPLGEYGEKLPKDKRDVRVSLRGIYRHYLGKHAGLAVWIVDGSRVRRDIHGDFCFGGHDKKYRFIPAGEVWLDAAMSVEEAWFALIQEMVERDVMAGGHSYDVAYPAGLVAQLDERMRQQELCRKHEAELAPVRYGTRERGVKK